MWFSEFFDKRNTQVSKLKGDVIVTMPRFKEATPITLARVDFSSSPCSPSFFPFPSWELQEVGKKGAIQSAVDLKIDTMVMFHYLLCFLSFEMLLILILYYITVCFKNHHLLILKMK